METQGDLFGEDGNATNAAPCRAQTAVADEAKRLNRQQILILARLREGPATNMELIPISTRFGGRIFELRKKGYRIDTTVLDRAGGLTLYTLLGESE